MRQNLVDKVLQVLQDESVLALSEKVEKVDTLLKKEWSDTDSFLDWKPAFKQVALLNSTILLNTLFDKGIRFKENWFPSFWSWRPTSEFALEMFSKDDTTLSKAYWVKTYSVLVEKKQPYALRAEMNLAEFLEELSPSAGNLGSVGLKQLVIEAIENPAYVKSNLFSFSEKEKEEFFKQYFGKLKFKLEQSFYSTFSKESFLKLYQTSCSISDGDVLSLVLDYAPSSEDRLKLYNNAPFSPMGMALLLRDNEVFEKLLPTFKIKDLNASDRKLISHWASNKFYGGLSVETGFINALFLKLYPLNFINEEKIKNNYACIERSLLKLKEVDPLFHISLKVIGKENGRPEDVFSWLNIQSGIPSEIKKEFFEFFPKLYTESHLVKNLKNIKVENSAPIPSRSNRF